MSSSIKRSRNDFGSLSEFSLGAGSEISPASDLALHVQGMFNEEECIEANSVLSSPNNSQRRKRDTKEAGKTMQDVSDEITKHLRTLLVKNYAEDYITRKRLRRLFKWMREQAKATFQVPKNWEEKVKNIIANEYEKLMARHEKRTFEGLEINEEREFYNFVKRIPFLIASEFFPFQTKEEKRLKKKLDIKYKCLQIYKTLILLKMLFRANNLQPITSDIKTQFTLLLVMSFRTVESDHTPQCGISYMYFWNFICYSNREGNLDPQVEITSLKDNKCDSKAKRRLYIEQNYIFDSVYKLIDCSLPRFGFTSTESE